jgi:hypothetical protein
LETPISEITRAKWTGDVVEAAECLLCKCKAESSDPSPTPPTKKEFSLCCQGNVDSNVSSMSPCPFAEIIQSCGSLSFLICKMGIKFYLSYREGCCEEQIKFCHTEKGFWEILRPIIIAQLRSSSSQPVCSSNLCVFFS